MSSRLSRDKPRAASPAKEAAIKVLFSTVRTFLGTKEKKSLRKPCMKDKSFTPQVLHAHGHTTLEHNFVDSLKFWDSIVSYQHHRLLEDAKYILPNRIPPLVVEGGMDEYFPIIHEVLPRNHNDKPKTSHIYHYRKQIPDRKISPTKKVKRQQVALDAASRTPTWNIKPKSLRPIIPETSELVGAAPPSGTSSSRPMPSRTNDNNNIGDLVNNPENSRRNDVGLNFLNSTFGGGGAMGQTGKGVSLMSLYPWSTWKRTAYTEGKSSRRVKRPFFTYWMTAVQLIIFIVVMSTYQIAPIGPTKKEIKDQVLVPSLVTQYVSREEKENLFIGPTQTKTVSLQVYFLSYAAI